MAARMVVREREMERGIELRRRERERERERERGYSEMNLLGCSYYFNVLYAKIELLMLGVYKIFFCVVES